MKFVTQEELESILASTSIRTNPPYSFYEILKIVLITLRGMEDRLLMLETLLGIYMPSFLPDQKALNLCIDSIEKQYLEELDKNAEVTIEGFKQRNTFAVDLYMDFQIVHFYDDYWQEVRNFNSHLLKKDQEKRITEI